MRPWAVTMWAALAAAQKVLDSASFGHHGRLSQDQKNVLGWRIMGTHDWHPQILSDRIILTPPGPGNLQAALWTEQAHSHFGWTADLEFRVSSPEHGGGALTLWYTKQGPNEIGTNSVYTVERFEGLGVLIDHDGSTGQIRAFLNDGRTSFASHPMVDALAFGHCDYNYRNLGRQSKLTLQSDSHGFQVTVDGKPCFRSDSVLLPPNYHFGLTAYSDDTPESFELFKFVTLDAPTGDHIPHDHQAHIEGNPEYHAFRDENYEWAEGSEHLADAAASSIHDQEAQFADLHDRLQAMSHSIDNLFKELSRHGSRIQTRLDDLNGPLAKIQHVTQLEDKVNRLETLVQQLRNEQKDWSGHFNAIENSLKSRHDALLASFPESMGNVLASKGPNMKMFLFMLVAFQLLLGAGYIVYKRRLARSHQKYL